MLPPAPDTRNLRNEKGGEAYVRFKRFHRDLVAARKEGKKHLTNYQEMWDRPLTEQDWELAANTNPAEAIAMSTGGSIPTPDPKEGDVVWV